MNAVRNNIGLAFTSIGQLFVSSMFLRLLHLDAQFHWGHGQNTNKNNKRVGSSTIK